MANSSTPQWQRPIIIGGSVVLVVALLYFAKAVLIPIVLAILLTFVLSPLVSALQRRGLRRSLSVILVVALAFVVIGAVGLAVFLEFKNLATELPRHKDEIVQKIVNVQEAGKGSWLENISATFDEIVQRVKSAGPEAATAEPVPVKPVASTDFWSVLQSAVAPVLEGVLTAVLVVVLVVFMLIQREDLRNRLIRLWGTGGLTRMTRALDDASQRISRFLLMQLLLNATYGLVLGLGLFLIGVPYALLWGFLAAVLRYIPYLGAWLAAVLPVAVSLALLPGLTQPLLAFALIVVLELITGNIIEPLLYGHSIGVSEVGLLVAVVFWTWLWGPVGLILAAPMTACLVVLGRYVPQLEFFSILLGAEPALEPRIGYYQRLLARDQDEAADLVEDYVGSHEPDEVYDEVLLPALILAKHNRERDELGPDDEKFIIQATRDVLDDLALSGRAAAGDEEKEPHDPAEAAVVVLGCPASDEMDEVALHMLRQLLDAEKCRLEVLSAHVLSAEVLQQIERERPSLVCIAALPPGGVAHARYLCKRLRARFPELKILVGCWGLTENLERIKDRLQSAGASEVGASLAETRRQLSSLLPVLVDSQRAEELAHSV